MNAQVRGRGLVGINPHESVEPGRSKLKSEVTRLLIYNTPHVCRPSLYISEHKCHETGFLHVSVLNMQNLEECLFKVHLKSQVRLQ